MPSKPKVWRLADEDSKYKVFRWEHETMGSLCVELRFSKVTNAWTAVRCKFTESESGWDRFETALKNHAVAKRSALEYLLDQAFEEVPDPVA